MPHSLVILIHLQCIADTGSFLDAAVDRTIWCSEVECRTRIVEEFVVLIIDDDDDDDDDVSSLHCLIFGMCY